MYRKLEQQKILKIKSIMKYILTNRKKHLNFLGYTKRKMELKELETPKTLNYKMLPIK